MCSCGITLGVCAIASMTSSVKSRGCGLVNRTAAQTCHLAARTKEVREPMMPAVAIRVDVLSQQGDLHDPFGHQLPTSARICSGERSCSVPRNDGTMQNDARVVAADD